MEEARRAAERTARASYGRLIAMLSSRNGDIAGAEDALADAFAAALARWPERGIPDNPDAWLLTAARRNLGHVRGRAVTASANAATIALIDEERAERWIIPFGDERLKLLFVCTHPAIATDVQAPLMLQTVLGLDAARIAAAFLVSPAAIGRQLSRAKAKIRHAGIAFVIPEPGHIAERVGAVLMAIYAAYGTAWEDVGAADARRKGLAGEAIWLGRLVAGLLRDDAEATGLLALMLHCEARVAARRDGQEAFVPLDRQNPALWSKTMIVEAEALLRAAARFGVPGRFQTEAAIQSLHAQAVMTGDDLSEPLIGLYDLLIALAPSVGARVARAAAYAASGRPTEAYDQLNAIADRCLDYQPWWVANARVLALLGRQGEAGGALATACGLTVDRAVREYLMSDPVFAVKHSP